MSYRIKTMRDKTYGIYNDKEMASKPILQCNQMSNAECIVAILNEDLNERNAFSLAILNGLSMQ